MTHVTEKTAAWLAGELAPEGPEDQPKPVNSEKLKKLDRNIRILEILHEWVQLKHSFGKMNCFRWITMTLAYQSPSAVVEVEFAISSLTCIRFANLAVGLITSIGSLSNNISSLEYQLITDSGPFSLSLKEMLLDKIREHVAYSPSG